MTSIIVTGAARGIGLAIAQRLANDIRQCGGAPRLVLSDRAGSAVAAVAETFRAEGCEAIAVEGDLADPAACAKVAQAAEAEFSGLDLLVSNAGMFAAGPLEALSLDDWDRVMNVNTRAAWLLAKASFPMLKRSRGQIVIIASISGHLPQPGLGSYSVSKAAVKMLTTQLAIEWGPLGIRTNSVSPGMTETPNVAHVYADPEARARREQMVPSRRIAAAEDIAGVVSFLAGPDGGMCNGADIVVDGGFIRSLLGQMPPTR